MIRNIFNKQLPLALAAILTLLGCAPDERHESEFYRICKDKNKTEAESHTVNEILALVSSPASCEQAHNYLMKTSSLTLAGKGISALEPLAGLPKLVELNLANNKISATSALTGLAKLRFLYLENNEITDVAPLSGLPELAVLNVSHNKLADLAVFAKFGALSRLYASHNTLGAAPGDDGEPADYAGEQAEVFAPLIKLDLSHNPKLAALPAEMVATVAELNISHTKIIDLAPLAGNTALTSIIADEIGGITDIAPLGGKPELAMVGLKNNKIKDIKILAAATVLRHLDISFNEVSSLRPLAASTNLKALFVEGNPIAIAKNQTKENCPQGDAVPEAVRTVCQKPAIAIDQQD